jgi:hypothetical protein
VLLAMALDELLQILSRVRDVFPQGRCGQLGVLRLASLKKLTMRLTGTVLVAGYDKV